MYTYSANMIIAGPADVHFLSMVTVGPADVHYLS